MLFLNIGDFKWKLSRAAGTYLAGYDYARPDHPDERTEEAVAKPELELYRHPEIQGVTSPKFRKAFDLFALGCVLLEVGLWSNLRFILKTTCSLTPSSDHVTWNSLIQSRAQLLQDIAGNRDSANIAFYAGETFKEVIALCLCASTEDPEDEDLETQKTVVDRLKECKF